MTTTDEDKKKKLEAQKQQEQARQELDALLDRSRPKNLGQGVTRGVSNIVGGALGAVGVAVVAPIAGGAVGLKGGGILGGVVGLAGGAVVGVVGAVGLAVGGAVSGVSQIVRGVMAVPQSVVAPSQGKWWNETEGKWIYTDLPKEFEALENVPEDDSDLLGEIEKEIDFRASTAGGTVKDPFYYDILEVEPKAEPAGIKRQYYVLARKYHPDKLDPDDTEGAEKFKDIAEAYQVLSDPELRAKYDKEGREGLSADKTTVADDVPKIDPTILFAFLFGSDQFNDYVGRLATATSASVGDSPAVSLKDARIIQKRRVTRLAVKMAAKLQPWVDEDYDLCKEMWREEALELSKASFGTELVHTIGKIYSLSAIQFLASQDSGVGLPSISKWATKQKAHMEQKRDTQKNQMDTLKAGMAMAGMQKKLAEEYENAKTEEEKLEIQAKMEDAMGTTMLKILWSTTVVDITNTLHEMAQMLCYDQSVDLTTRTKRGHGLKNLGEIWMECPAQEEPDNMDTKHLYEEAAFAAMVETIKRKDEAAHPSS